VPYLRLGRNPIYYLGDGGFGIRNNSKAGIELRYLAGDANDPADGSACLMVHTVLCSGGD